jgi:hypothetical protein
MSHSNRDLVDKKNQPHLKKKLKGGSNAVLAERGAPQDPMAVDRQRTKITGSLSNFEIPVHNHSNIE